MPISVLDLFSIGIGPSSSHCIGPMRAANRFVQELRQRGALDQVRSIRITLYGALALTGKGHGTDRAIMLGLQGKTPEGIDTLAADSRADAFQTQHQLQLPNGPDIPFDAERDIRFFTDQSLPLHPNAMEFEACRDDGRSLLQRIFYSIGGGFLVDEQGAPISDRCPREVVLPYPFHSAAALVEQARRSGLPISGVMLANEAALYGEAKVRAALLRVWQVMRQSVRRGCTCEGILPGGLNIERRAPGLHRQLSEHRQLTPHDPLAALDWVDLFALAVSEENAAGGRVVTAPTNGAAGIVPAVLHYYHQFIPGANAGGTVRFLLAAGAIAILYKENASISGAEMGCQGEVGVACSMSAGALTEVLGGTPQQVEQAAEIAMEHNLGLTCDPVGGLVQVPCIERNAVAAVEAVNASRLALRSDGTHRVSLDRVIATMRQTGTDMMAKYKETSLGGLAVNVTEC
jgi:L-serine dehydratase